MKALRRPIGLAIAALALVLNACGGVAGGAGASISEAGYPIEPIFAEFYEFLGGEARLGIPLSQLIASGQMQQQYVEAALLRYDASAAPSERYSLAPLGLEQGERDAPLAGADLPGARVVDGFILYEGFVELYEELGGERYVGKPLTGVRYLEEEKRVEQYFENLAFFLDLDEAGAGAQLMPLGRLACAQDCPSSNQSAAISQPDRQYGEPFTSAARALGEAFVGARLAGPYETADGEVEVVYENLVLYVRLGSPDQALARPLALLLGLPTDAPVPRLDNPNIVFYSVEGELGYNVPRAFNDYLADHGGAAVSGPPISEVRALSDGSFSQCFTNLCLQYIQEGQGGKVQPLAMGAEYQRRFGEQAVRQVLNGELQVQIQVWEEHAQINSSQEQTVYASLFAGNQLLEGLEPTLLLRLPNGSEDLYRFPPTDGQGRTQLVLPPINGRNGTLIPYEVCLQSVELGEICVEDSYMLWGNP